MTKRKILLVAMALSMVAILAVGGSLAYLTDTEQAYNTMVIGNVRINIDEVTYMDENGDGEREWKKFENDKFTLYPIDNAQGSKLYNKMVYTANTSPSEDAAYIRNIVLIEANEKITAANTTGCCFPGIHYSFHNGAEPTVSNTDNKTYYGAKEVGTTTETYTINGEEYYVIVFVEVQERAIPYDACLQTLSSVWVDQNVTSEQMTGWGDKCDIIVFSQGIQAEGLTHAAAMEALGEVNEANLQTWLGEANEATLNDWTSKN